MPKKLIINADDYGRTEGVSRGIRFAHLNGIITSTTSMMNLPGVGRELELAMTECPGMGLGVHLNITAGVPINRSLNDNRLCSSDGIFNKPEILQKMLPSLDLDAVTMEWDAQITEFIRFTGSTPAHLDSHHHVSYFSPGLFQRMLILAQKYHAAIRLPVISRASMEFSILPFEPNPGFQETIAEMLLTSGILAPDRFYNSFYGPGATSENLLGIINGLGEDVNEIMCHPGYNDPFLAAVSAYSVERERELAILTDPFVRENIANLGIQLVNFQYLK